MFKLGRGGDLLARLFWLLAISGSCRAAVDEDLIKKVPGFDGPLPSRQWSGYLTIPGGKHLHYVFVESEGDPKTDPVVLWLNGGPGCSSLDGYVYEHGPFVVDEKDHRKLSLREYRWNLHANVLYLEAPVGVGFSTADDPAVYGQNDDDSTASDNLRAVEAFFSAKFPELRGNPFYITGESYAGIYVPTLAEAILNASILGTWTGPKLKGIAVGNGCTGTEVGICGSGPQADAYLWQYMLQTGFVSHDVKAKALHACDFRAAVEELRPFSAECQAVLTQASEQVGFINLYDVYGDCISSYRPEDSHLGYPLKAPHSSSWAASLRSHGSNSGGVRGPVACINSFAATAFFSDPEVQDAYHVKPPNGADDTWQFSVCGQASRDWRYRSTRPNLPRDTYPTLVRHMKVLIYSGDFDACVPRTDSESWTRMLSFPVKRAFHAWNYTSISGASKQVAGYAVEYDVASNAAEPQASFVFTTIRGGRHEVPESAPAQALEMLRRFLEDEPF